MEAPLIARRTAKLFQSIAHHTQRKSRETIFAATHPQWDNVAKHSLRREQLAKPTACDTEFFFEQVKQAPQARERAISDELPYVSFLRRAARWQQAPYHLQWKTKKKICLHVDSRVLHMFGQFGSSSRIYSANLHNRFLRSIPHSIRSQFRRCVCVCEYMCYSCYFRLPAAALHLYF